MIRDMNGIAKDFDFFFPPTRCRISNKYHFSLYQNWPAYPGFLVWGFLFFFLLLFLLVLYAAALLVLICVKIWLSLENTPWRMSSSIIIRSFFYMVGEGKVCLSWTLSLSLSSMLVFALTLLPCFSSSSSIVQQYHVVSLGLKEFANTADQYFYLKFIVPCIRCGYLYKSISTGHNSSLG